MIDVAIKSDRIITPDGIRKATVLIKDGKITDVAAEEPEGHFPVIDVGNCVLMAGVVDPHVHINEPAVVRWSTLSGFRPDGCPGRPSYRQDGPGRSTTNPQVQTPNVGTDARIPTRSHQARIPHEGWGPCARS